MTAYDEITNGEVAVGAPITTALMTALRDNPISALEADSTAIAAGVLNSCGWQEYDSVTGEWGTGATNPLYDNSVDGNVANVESPTFDSGYDYLFLIDDLSHNSSNRGIRFQAYLDVDESWVTLSSSPPNTDAGVSYGGLMRVLFPDVEKTWHPYQSIGGGFESVPQSFTGSGAYQDTTPQKITAMRVNFTGGSVDNGTVRLFRITQYGGL